jgi:hypothetical protein
VVRIELGEQVADTAVTALGSVTVTSTEADFVAPVLSSLVVAVMVAVPGENGAKTPAPLTLPIFAGATDQFTTLLKLPVPFTVGEQVDVWVVRMDVAEQVIETEAMVQNGVSTLP